MSTTAEPDTIAALAERFPKWHIWRGRSGEQLKGWYATRWQRLSRTEERSGLSRTLAANTAEYLREQLEQQAATEAQP